MLEMPPQLDECAADTAKAVGTPAEVFKSQKDLKWMRDLLRYRYRM